MSNKLFDQKVDIAKVNKPLFQRWIKDKLNTYLSNDDIVAEFALTLLMDVQFPDIRDAMAQLEGFMAEDTKPFCKELWRLLLAAQIDKDGIPEEFVTLRMEQMDARAPPTQEPSQRFQGRGAPRGLRLPQSDLGRGDRSHGAGNRSQADAIRGRGPHQSRSFEERQPRSFEERQPRSFEERQPRSFEERQAKRGGVVSQVGLSYVPETRESRGEDHSYREPQRDRARDRSPHRSPRRHPSDSAPPRSTRLLSRTPSRSPRRSRSPRLPSRTPSRSPRY